MRKLLLSVLLLGTAAASYAQTVATFDDLTLSKPDTFYVNYSSPGNDVGFSDGGVHFPCVYDTAYGGLWDYGFAYTNMTDSITDGYTNLYSAITASGDSGSANYAAVSNFNPISLWINASPEWRAVTGFYITNSTYAYKSMLYGNDYPAKKFGGPTGNDPDWFKLTIHGYNSYGQLVGDSVDFYLADYRFADNDSDYIVKDWKWIDLSTFYGEHVDSLQFTLSSSDTAGGFGMNTPAYYCIDNFTTAVTEGITNTQSFVAKVYPNPTTDQLFIDIKDNSVQQATVYDVAGRQVGNYAVSGNQLVINTASLPAGNYILKLEGNNKTANVRFVKQ